MAYADWSATPVTPTPAALAAAVAACNRIDSRTHYSGTPMLTGQPVLTDARGKYVAAIYASGSSVNVCISDGHDTGSSTGGGTLGFYATPGPDQLGLPTGGGGSAPGFPGANPNQPLPPQMRTAMQAQPQLKNNPSLLAKDEAERQHALDQGVETHLVGLAGSDIADATFVFANGKTVTATVQNGWYFAWWPNIDQPTSVQVTTRDGKTITSQMHCKPGTNSCMLAGINPDSPLLPPKGATTIAPRPQSGVPTRTTPRTAATTTAATTTNP
jgi:hypothetical protein